MKNALRTSGFGAMLLAIGLLMSGCYTQLGTVGDDSSSSSSYDEYSNQDTTQTYSNDMSQYYNGYDDNFYGTNSFSRYRFFSFYYPTSYWNWAYDPWYDYSWNNPWYNPWYNPYYGGGYWGGYPYYGGYYGYYPYYPSGYVTNGSASNGARRPFGQGRGGTATMAPGRGSRGAYTPNGYVGTTTVDLPPAASIRGASRSGAVQPASTVAPAKNQPRGTAVSRPSGNSGNRTNATPSSGSGNRGRGEGRSYSQPSSPPPAPASSGGSRSGGGARSGGGERSGGSGGGQRSGGGGRGR